jgi:hypothetical protein
MTAMIVQIDGGRREEREHGQQQEEAREHEHQVDQPHDGAVHPATVIAGGGTEQDADGGGDADRDEAHGQRDARAIEHA